MVSYFKGREKLRVFENKILRKIFGPKRDKQTDEWRKLQNVELHNLYGTDEWRKLQNVELHNLYGNAGVIRMLKSHRL